MTTTAQRRILFLLANPEETTRLNLETEVREVKGMLLQGTYRETLELQLEPGVRVEDLQHLLDRLHPDVVHFSGHGSARSGEIILYNAKGESFPVPKESLAKALARVECVFLNACSSADQARAIAALGPVAIGMDGPISTSDATCFSRTFYGKLANGVGFHEAFEGARLQLGLEARPGRELPRIFPQQANRAGATTPPEARIADDVPIPEGQARRKVVDLALAEAETSVRVTVCVVSDEHAALLRGIHGWRKGILRSPLIPAVVKERLRGATLLELFDNQVVQGQLFDWLSTTTFSAYAYFAATSALGQTDPKDWFRRLRTEPLTDRLRKRSEQIASIRSSVDDFKEMAEPAIEAVLRARIGTQWPLSPPSIVKSKPGEDDLVNLAQIVANVIARHLGDRSDELSSAHFNCISTRLRFATDVVSGARHTRVKNPLL